MAIFGREEKDDIDDEESLNQKIPTRKFKDLNPKDRKKRKEPPRPWGKKERILVLSILLTTVITSVLLALWGRDWKLPGLPKISFPSLDFFSGETIVIEKGENKNKDTEIIAAFNNETKALSGTYGLYVVRLSDGSSYGVNGNQIYQAASLIKLPTLATLYKEAEAGHINLDTKYTLKNSDKTTGSGSLSSQPAGYVLTYRDMAKLMGSQSDNTAFGIIKGILGEDKINATTLSLGMKETSLSENTTTLEDISLFFQKLMKGGIVSPKHRDELLGYMTDTIYENWLALGIPKKVKVAHKYGREIHVVNDAGVVFAREPFILVIMTKGVVEREADEVFPKLAKIVYDGENGN